MYVFYGVLSNAIGAREREREREREIALQRPHAFEIDFNTRVFTAQMCTCMHVLYVCVCGVCLFDGSFASIRRALLHSYGI